MVHLHMDVFRRCRTRKAVGSVEGVKVIADSYSWFTPAPQILTASRRAPDVDIPKRAGTWAGFFVWMGRVSATGSDFLGKERVIL